MRRDLTDITVLLDRSGSMQSCRSDAEGGLKAFIDKQREVPGECRLSLVQFDGEYEPVFTALDVKLAPHILLVPRGNTALLDAMGKAIESTGERLAAMREEDRPGLVIFVCVTDGEENSSHEYSRERVKALVERQQSEWKWSFIFLGADMDAFGEANSIGYYAANIAKISKGKFRRAFHTLNSNVVGARGQSIVGASDAIVAASLNWSAEQREDMA